MGLSTVPSRIAARHAHALVVEVPGWGRTRLLVERAVLTRGWQLAQSPADADVLIVCGVPGRQLTEAVDLVWHQMPGPRVRVEVRQHGDTANVLNDAHARLLDHAHHQRDARHRPGADDLLAQQPHDAEAGHDHGEPGSHKDRGERAQHRGDEGEDGDQDGREESARHEGHGGSGGHEDHDGGGGHGGHEGHSGHGDMDMSPGGIALAGGGEDRDGLEMDVLKVRLGPVLPHWPAGLVLHCSLQGDVLTEARAGVLAAGDDGADEADARTRGLDNLVSVLALTGWDGAAAQARRIRDAALEPGDRPADLRGLERLRRQVRRSWAVRWSLRGLRPLTEDEVRHHGLPGDTVGDTYDRLVRMVDRSAAATPHSDRPAVRAESLGELVVGLDLAAARLVLASLDIHELLADHAGHGVAHG